MHVNRRCSDDMILSINLSRFDPQHSEAVSLHSVGDDDVDGLELSSKLLHSGLEG